MDSITGIDRRQLLRGAAAATAIAVTATAACAAGPGLAGKAFLITGTSSGFGHIGALHYARQGAKVIASMRRMPRPEAETLRKAARDEKLDLHVVEIDVTDDASVVAGVREAERIAGGGLDVLVNNAGVAVGGPVELSDTEAARLMFETNVIGPLRMARAALPLMRAKKGGVVFNVTSQLGRVIVPNYGLYSATKFALEAMSEQMAYELVPHAVEVTIIEPGGYPTNIWRNSAALTDALIKRSGAERTEAYAALVATARRGDPGLSTNPLDVPRAIAEIAAMPPGQRPLRRPVHPNYIPQTEINAVSAETQRRFLGQSPFGPWVEAVLD